MRSRKPEERLLPVETQLQQERAEGLGRAGWALEEALCQLPALEQAVRQSSGAARAEALAAHEAQRRKALHLHWCLVVQREAVGLRHHGELDALYPVPPPLED